MKNHTIWNLQKISTYCKNPTTACTWWAVHCWKRIPHVSNIRLCLLRSGCVYHREKPLRGVVFSFCSQRCTATIIQLPSQKQLWLTKPPLTCLAIRAGVVSLQPHRRCALLTLAFKSSTQANVASNTSPLNLPTLGTISHKLLDPPNLGGRSEQCSWVVRCIFLSCSGCSVACWKLLNAPNLLKISAAP